MPSAQVINFGEDPYANAMGGFAKSFLGELDKRSSKRRNDELFEQIKSKYGKDAPIEDILRDITMAEGFDQDYKTDIIKNVTELAKLKAKNNKNPYEEIKLKLREREVEAREKTNQIAEDRVKNQGSTIDQREKRESRNFSKDINSYNSKILKDSNIDMSENDRADLNYFTEDLVSQGKSLTEASGDALKLVQMRRDKIDNERITPYPSWGSRSEQNVNAAMEQAYQQLKQMYEEDGITDQKDLRNILENSGWKGQSEEIKKIIGRILKEDGRSLRWPKKSTKTEDNADEFFGV